MDLKEIMTIAGQSGLFKTVSKGKNVLIVESIESGKRMPVHSNQRASSLEEISVFTESDDLPLKKVLVIMYLKESGKAVTIPAKAEEGKLRDYFSTIVPNHDQKRVYLSDIRKILLWYNQLLQIEGIEWNDQEPVAELPAEEPENQETKKDQ